MSFALLFWVLMLLWLVFGIWAAQPPPNTPFNFRPFGSTLLLFILLLLLGWKVFQAPVHP